MRPLKARLSRGRRPLAFRLAFIVNPIDSPRRCFARAVKFRAVGLYPPFRVRLRPPVCNAQPQPILFYRAKTRMATRKGKGPPAKYFRGLSATKRAQRKREISHFGAFHWKDPRAYTGFTTNRGVNSKASGYTAQWTRLFPEAKSLEAKAAVTGVPLRFLKESYNRGMAAWRTGHRPGATQQQWGYARVHSFLLCGKTFLTTDADIVKRAKGVPAAAKWWASRGC